MKYMIQLILEHFSKRKLLKIKHEKELFLIKLLKLKIEQKNKIIKLQKLELDLNKKIIKLQKLYLDKLDSISKINNEKSKYLTSNIKALESSIKFRKKFKIRNTKVIQNKDKHTCLVFLKKV